MAIAALALVLTAGLLAAQPGGWIGAPSGDGEAAVPDAWPPSGDAAFAWLLPGYAFAQSVALNLTAAGSITDTTTLELDGAAGIATFTSGGSTYAAVASYYDDGVQILNITDPSNVTAAGSITDTPTLKLDGAWGIATFESDSRAYAAVASYYDDGVQILDITDPSNVTAAGSIGNTDALELDGARGIAVFESGGSTYAAVASLTDNGVQILNITNPSNVTAAGSITDTPTLKLDGAWGIATFRSGGSTYAAVTAYDDSGVQILNVTNPSNVTAAGSIGNTDALVLGGAEGIATFTSGGSTYAAVASLTDNGVQILNITNPSNVTAAGSITNTPTLKLDGAWGIATFRSGGSTYAAVTAYDDSGVQILNVTNPSNVTAAGSIGNTDALVLGGAEGIATFTSGGSAYAAVAAYDDDGVQILRLTNSPPVVGAGADQEAAEGSTVTLDGTASDTDTEDTLTYAWSHNSTLSFALDDDSAPDPSFTAPNVSEDTVVEFTLAVSDGMATVSDKALVTILDSANSAPSPDAGADQEAAEGATVSLSGTATDGDPEDTPTYSWTHDGAPSITITGSDSASASFTAPNVAANTTITVTLTVNDGTVDASDTLQVTITDSPNSPPTVNAGQDQEVAEGATVSLSGTATDDDPEDVPTYSWTHDGAPSITITGSDSASASFTAPNVAANTTITVTLTVNDGTVDASDTLQVTITDSPNRPPTVNAGQDQEVAEGATVSLSGTATDGDPEDTPTYSWTHDGAPSITITGSDSASASFTAPNVAANTTITVTLTVNDGTVDASDTLQVTITDSPNRPPTVNAGQDQEVAEGATVSLSGTATDGDPEDTPTYSWTHDGAPSITITGSDSASASFTAPNVAANTTITVTLTVNDGTVDASDTLQVTITDSPNRPPTVNAGQDQEVAEGATVSLSGTATDGDPEDTPTYSWTHDGAPSITITGSDSASASFTAPNVAANTTITVTLTVNDGTVDASDTLQVTITDSPNSPPTVNAGQDQEVAEGATVSLSGTATDGDPEDTPTYSWTHDGAPSITITGSDSASASFTAPNVAANTTITVTLTVNDGTVDASDTLQVTITDSPNSPPTVNAGQDQEVAEGATVSLSGTATDGDPEDTPTYSWTHDGAPSITITGSDSASASFTAPNVAANTTITVTLTVNDGTVDASDTLQVTITDSPNRPPTVNAGQDQEVAEGATVSLSGTATDGDPEDTPTYSWTHDGAPSITITGSDSASASFTAPNVAANTTITVTLTVNDGTVDASDTLQVTITDSPNSPPTVNAGQDQEVAEGATVSLSGTATDGDPEDTPTYSWTHDGAPSITITGSDSASASFTAPNVAANTTITVTLTVNDGTVDASDTLQVTITDSPNRPPTVNAGQDQEVAEGATVSLSGTATDGDPEDTPTYSWTHDGAPSITITGSDSASASFTAPNVAANTTITVTLTVNDGTVDASDTLQVTITDSPNSPPTVNAGQDQEVAEGATVSLSGTATDGDPEDTLTYAWSHNSTLSFALDDDSAPDPSFTAPNVAEDTPVLFTLAVTDGTATATDSLVVTITDSPVQTGSSSASWSVDQVIRILGSKGGHALDMHVRCDEGTMLTDARAGTYLQAMWQQFGTADLNDAIDLSNLHIDLDWVNRVPGEWLIFRSIHYTPNDRIAEGIYPLDAGITINQYMDAASSDIFEYPTGNYTKSQIGNWEAYGLSIKWEGDGSCRMDLDHSNIIRHSPSTEFTAPQVNVTTTASANRVATVETPKASLGPRDIGRITLNGTAPGTVGVSWDAPGETPAGYRVMWAKVGESYRAWTDSAGNAYPTSPFQTITGLDGGAEYKVKVRATYDGDSGDWSGEATVAVARSPANDPPTVDAGNAQTVQEGLTVTLNGTASDPDGDALTYLWSHDSAMNVTFPDPSSLAASFTAPQVDSNTTITITLTVSDGNLTVSDSVDVTVTDAPVQVSQSDPRGVYRLTLSSTESGVIEAVWDAPGEAPIDYRISWAKAGESYRAWTDSAGNAFPTDASYTITDLEEGAEYKVQVRARYDGTAGDWSGEAATAVARSPANDPPTVDAGNAQTVQEGLTVTLNGTASDPDGDALTYLWSHDSAMNVTFSDPSSLAASFTAPQVDSNTTITITLTVSDGNLTVSDSVDVTVTDAPVQVSQSDPRGVYRLTLSSTESGVIEAVWDAPGEAPIDYRISWAKAGESYRAWTDSAGNAFPTDASYTITDLEEGAEYKVQVRARYNGTAGDWSGEAATAVARSPANDPPTVDAGNAQTVQEGLTVTLNGTASDPDGDALTYLWSHDSAMNVTFSDPSSLAASFTAPQVDSNTTITITLTVSDGNLTVSDSVDVTVTDAPVQVSQSDPRGVYRLTLSSTESGVIEAVWDAPGEAPIDYRISWAKAGESYRAWTDSAGNAFPTDASYTITDLEEGAEYKVQVRARYNGTAGDWSGEAATAVARSPANDPPTVDAGNAQTVQEGLTVTLNGTASDPDGDALTYTAEYNFVNSRQI